MKKHECILTSLYFRFCCCTPILIYFDNLRVYLTLYLLKITDHNLLLSIPWETNELNEDIYVDSYKYTSPDGEEYWIPKCDKKSKPYVNQMFPDVEAVFEFYTEYGRLCGLVVRKSSAKYKGGVMTHKYVECSSAGRFEGKTIKRRRTNTRKCECEAKIILKNCPTGYYIGTFLHDNYIFIHQDFEVLHQILTVDGPSTTITSRTIILTK